VAGYVRVLVWLRGVPDLGVARARGVACQERVPAW